MGLPVVAIVGRPNVGKSSLLNCLARRRISIVDPTAGVTRDRVSTVIEAEGQLPRYTNIMLRFEVGVGEKEAPEFYAKVIRPLDESSNLYLIHFTSIAPAIRAILNQLLRVAQGP